MTLYSCLFSLFVLQKFYLREKKNHAWSYSNLKLNISSKSRRYIFLGENITKLVSVPCYMSYYIRFYNVMKLWLYEIYNIILNFLTFITYCFLYRRILIQLCIACICTVRRGESEVDKYGVCWILFKKESLIICQNNNVSMQS